MSECEVIRDALLEAELDELTGAADSELARHVRHCPPCRAAAQAIVEATQQLAAALDTPAPPLDVDAVLARARPEIASVEHGRGIQAARWRRWAWVAAAAAVGGLLLLGERERPLPGQPFTPPAQAYSTVEAPTDRNVVVMPTENPDITVLWFF